MKNLKIILLIALGIFSFSCEEKKDDDTTGSTTSTNTPTVLPVVTTDAITDIGPAKATFKATLVKEGATAAMIRGFCWSKNPKPTVGDLFSSNAFGPGPYSHTATNLDPNTTYYVRAYATNSFGTQYGNERSFTTKPEYKIGDTGPAGGIIFYLDGTDGGLEAAPASTEQTLPWGCLNQTITGTQYNIGSGLNNTEQIANQCSESGIAAKMTLNLSYNGFDDWYMPSNQELSAMYQNLHKIGKGDFSNTEYWSSTQSSPQYAIVSNFASSAGGGGGMTKSMSLRVRAIRSF